MAAQKQVSGDLLQGKLGKVIEVLIDEVDEDGAIGRSRWDAPEIDGNVFLNGEDGCKPGDIACAPKSSMRMNYDCGPSAQSATLSAGISVRAPLHPTHRVWLCIRVRRE